jgi:hypothetical protein
MPRWYRMTPEELQKRFNLTDEQLASYKERTEAAAAMWEANKAVLWERYTKALFLLPPPPDEEEVSNPKPTRGRQRAKKRKSSKGKSKRTPRSRRGKPGR